ncbi:uncharacterized protein [Diabrotica undecimpunctata]|uniref:uncharacterized protein n=1 Tax=Diabrotica undecimpunctata TaxID=50387 RepID=UPI003B6338A0
MLKELGNFIKNNKDELTETSHKIDINWKFTPPFSPHFGGLWKAGIKSIKHHLRRVAKDLILTYEQLSTLLIEIEAILNSRPLSLLSDSVHDFNPLTPSHFLIGRPATSLSKPDVTATPVNRLSMYQHLLQVRQHIWQHWSKQYVSELQQRTKLKLNFDSLRTGSLVIIKEDHQPPLKWKLRRVENLHVGNDEVARVATIRTADGMIKRSFSKICPLPVEV